MHTTSSAGQWVAKSCTTIEVRPYQMECLATLWNKRESGSKRALVSLATGLGKTSVAAMDVLHFIQEEQATTPRVLFVSHMRDISAQAKRNFSRISSRLPEHTTFTTFQGLHRKLATIPSDYYDYIVWDEAHHIEATTFREVREHFNPQFELGLSATPERADGLDIFDYFGVPMYEKSLADGISEGWLSTVDYHIVFDEAISSAINNGFKLTTIKDIRSLFAIRTRNEVISKEVLDRRHVIGMDKAKTIIFCQSIDAAEKMATLLHGEVYHSEIDSDTRQNILERFKNGSLQVICTVDMFNEGIDIPDARLIVFLRSTSSRTIFNQQLGRGLRRSPGKDKVTVLDFVANVERINFVRELGHTISTLRETEINYPGKNTSGNRAEATILNPYFDVSNFDFEDETIELLERYKAIKDQVHLTREQVVADWHELKSIPQIAKKHSVSWNAIHKHLTKAGIDTSLHTARAISTEDIVNKYRELKSSVAVGRHFGIDAKTVRDRLKKANESILPINQKAYASPELIEAYNRLGTINKAAIELEIPRATARIHLINSGVYKKRDNTISLSRDRLARIYEATDGDINQIVTGIGEGWVYTYKMLDRYGFLDKRDGPITSAQAAAAYYKFGTSVAAAEYLGVSSSLVSRLSKDAKYIRKYRVKSTQPK